MRKRVRRAALASACGAMAFASMAAMPTFRFSAIRKKPCFSTLPKAPSLATSLAIRRTCRVRHNDGPTTSHKFSFTPQGRIHPVRTRLIAFEQINQLLL